MKNTRNQGERRSIKVAKTRKILLFVSPEYFKAHVAFAEICETIDEMNYKRYFTIRRRQFEHNNMII